MMMAEEILYSVFPGNTKLEQENASAWSQALNAEELERTTATGDTVEEAVSQDIANARTGGFHIAVYLIMELIREAYENVRGGARHE